MREETTAQRLLRMPAEPVRDNGLYDDIFEHSAERLPAATRSQQRSLTRPESDKVKAKMDSEQTDNKPKRSQSKDVRTGKNKVNLQRLKADAKHLTKTQISD